MFKKLIIFEMANNHQGLLSHALNIVDKYSNISKKNKINSAIKLQYRDLNTFISKQELQKKQNKHVGRFISTSLNRKEFKKICLRIKKQNLKLIITPFDEQSVENAIEDKVDILKIASCSSTDWPLLEKIAIYNKPVIFSTGGQNFESIDNIYSFFSHKNLEFAIMHCVSIYPTELRQAQLSMIKKFLSRFPDVKIGYSGHERPDDLTTVQVAIGCGATIFERHIGIPNKSIKLNSYSMNPIQTNKWVECIIKSIKSLGNSKKKNIPFIEKTSIEDLQRGIFANKKIAKGKKIKLNDIYYAFPLQKNQISSGEFSNNIKATKNYKPHDAIKEKLSIKESKLIRKNIHNFKGMFNEAGVVVGNYEHIELSHHYGIDKFEQYGCILITIINKSYCKKLIGLIPGQKHPSHRHYKKTESFHILYGTLSLVLDDIKYDLKKGDTISIEKGMWHSFSTKKGCIFEEISTKSIVGDSKYKDLKINYYDPYERKTQIDEW